jgi:CheY-like chemotaxis protein
MDPIEVLVIDDDPTTREVIVDFLSLRGCLTLEARSGRAALDLLRSRLVRPTVILLDLVMPEMDGWRFRAEQLADPSLSAIPVIAMSACRSGPDIAVQAVIPKPFGGEELLRTVARVADLRLS